MPHRLPRNRSAFAGSSPDTPIALPDDDDGPAHGVLNQVVRLIERRNSYGAHQHDPIQILDDSDDDDEVVILEQEIEADVAILPFIDLTADDEPRRRRRLRRHPPRPVRNAPLEHPLVPLAAYNTHFGILKQGVTVELDDPIGRFEIEFVRIELLFQDDLTGEVKLRGVPYTRTRCLMGMLHRRSNEICRIFEVDDDDDRPPEEQSMVEVSVNDIVGRRHLNITNARYPEHRFERSLFRSQEHAGSEGALVCRWTYTIRYRSAALREASRAHDWCMSHTMAEDALFRRFRIEDEANLNIWRGGKMLGGTHFRRRSQAPRVVIDDSDNEWDIGNGNQGNRGERATWPSPGQKYTTADLFCGAGGASRGMQSAGFHLELGVDHWPAACATYTKCFPRTRLYQQDIFDFITQTNTGLVDVLHLSPPCQTWSPAHTRPGRNDELNIAALFSCSKVVEKLKPRLFTLEQTYGILHGRFEPYFNALVQGFTEHGYSVRWRIVWLSSWGLPQNRRRLIMIGSCLGEKLPDFPPPTHGDGPGLHPRVGVAQALATISPNATWHDVAATTPKFSEPWDASVPLRRTITCSGGDVGCVYSNHPSGTRTWTLRELACLQGFPNDHDFCGPHVRKQIGNAFPAVVVGHLFRHLRKHLLRADGMDPSMDPGAVRDSPIEIGGGDDDEIMVVNGDLHRPAAGIPVAAAAPVAGPPVVIVLDSPENDAISLADSSEGTAGGEAALLADYATAIGGDAMEVDDARPPARRPEVIVLDGPESRFRPAEPIVVVGPVRQRPEPIVIEDGPPHQPEPIRLDDRPPVARSRRRTPQPRPWQNHFNLRWGMI